jgi:putative transposase
MRYVEMNPVRAGMARHPVEYPWSSHAENASGAPSGILSPHSEYQRLGSDPASRGLAYRLLFNSPLSESTLAAIRDASAKERALGEPTFLKMISGQIGREATPLRQGRPRIGVEN